MRYILLLFILFNSLFGLNHLANEPSPYLQQHKNNPVDWYPWGREAFAKAKRENKLIFLSIGYSTCHWCHVMAKESFTDKKVAEILNKYYISIKVDKEQYPQIDEYYQGIYRLFNRQGGGWPLTIILTPNKKPIFAQTYVPKYSQGNYKGLMDILPYLAKIDKKTLEKEGSKALRVYNSYLKATMGKAKISKNIAKKALNGYSAMFDKVYKGFGNSMKFPQAINLDALLTIYELNGSKRALSMVTQTLDAMAKGGIYDQIDGGFFRYTVDRKWNIPHFEKMLYTNAELIDVYAKAYELNRKALYKKVVKESIDNIDKHFKTHNLYMSASNADSRNFDGEEEEGFYFVFEYDKVLDYLTKLGFSKSSVKQNLSYLDITEDGNFHGDYSNPHINNHIKPDNNLDKIIKALQEYRAKKSYPFIDYKINTSWNAQFIKALIDARVVDKKYLKEGLSSLDSLMRLMYKNKILYHQTVLPHKPTQKGFLEDYAFVTDALFSAYEATLDKKYFKLYKEILLGAKRKFFKNKMWYLSDDSFKIPAKLDDGSYKNPLATLLKNLYILAVKESDIKLMRLVKNSLDNYSNTINTAPEYSSSGLELALMIQNDVIAFKSKKEKALNAKLGIRYPFLYKFSEDTPNYLACDKSSCFSFSKDLSKVKRDILRKIRR